MNQNIFYYITEQPDYVDEIRKPIDLDELKMQVNYNFIQENPYCIQESESELTNQELEDLAYTLEIDYMNNYTVKSLGQIMDYYELNKKNLKKNEIVQSIVYFEIEPTNKPIVEKRIRLWENIRELKNDKYFGKYIFFDV
jgi:hypothetical protein